MNQVGFCKYLSRKKKAPLGIFFTIREDGSGALVVKEACHLYSYASYLLENCLDDQVEKYTEGKHVEPAFDWNRVTYDFFLTQEGENTKVS